MAYQLKMLAAGSGNLSLFPRIHMLGGENWLLQIVRSASKEREK